MRHQSLSQHKKNKPAARILARQVVYNSLDKDLDLQAVLDKAITMHGPDNQEKNLLTQLSYGYLRYKGRIDYLLALFLKNPTKLPSQLHLILGLAAYEILFLDRIPDHAGVDQAVRQSKKLFGAGLGKLVNAVLRKICELPKQGQDEQLYTQDKPGLDVFYSRYFSCPLWIVRYLLQSYNPESLKQYLSSFLQQPPPGIRFNLTKKEGQQLKSKNIDDFDYTVSYEKGWVSRQSLAAQQVMQELKAVDWPEPIWDACAGRGGKSLFLAENNKKLFSSDLHLKRLIGLRQEQRRLGLKFPVFKASASDYQPKSLPQTIVLDAPCSGLGVLSRRPDSKWKRKEKDITNLSKIQAAMLSHAGKILSPGGKLVYITCTLGGKENEQQIQFFCRQNPELKLIKEFNTPLESDLHEFFYAALLAKK